ncbi:MAG: CoB--CoM heterodisulfide reductase iron-sulfur subunit A family protein [Chloroflexi bacterium]|nr:CoB--CoM heterodisulfide reductase iron-sulfur subunit A family protein [Chloroflexota bacterium]
MNNNALVIGGGIAGIQTALDIADAGFRVFLVEKEPSVGGRMSQLDKTFPTLDCSACILTPKMVDVSRHPNIELLTYAEVTQVVMQPPVMLSKANALETLRSAQGNNPSNFHVTVKKKPRYVDITKCTGCGSCAEACRFKGKVVDTFNAEMGKCSAIYVPFPQAVPLKYTVDPTQCIYLTRGVCGKTFLCKDACKAGAIDFTQKEEFVDLDVGAVVVATGFDPFNAKLKPELGYGIYPNVINSLQFERLSSASGPTAGKILLNGKEPREVAFIQCVGSRDETTGNLYCSRVCCMITAKHAHLVKDKIHDSKVTVFYADIRAFGKGFEEFYDRVREEGVNYRRGYVSEIYKRGEKLVIRSEDTLIGKPIETTADLVVLSTGLVPRPETNPLAKLFGLTNSADGFLAEAHAKMRPVDTAIDGVYLAGCVQGPKDIPDTVAHAKAAAAAAIVKLKSQQSTVNSRQNEKVFA